MTIPAPPPAETSRTIEPETTQPSRRSPIITVAEREPLAPPAPPPEPVADKPEAPEAPARRTAPRPFFPTIHRQQARRKG